MADKLPGTPTPQDGPLGVGQFDASDNLDTLHIDSDLGTGDSKDRLLLIFKNSVGTLKKVYFDDSAGTIVVV